MALIKIMLFLQVFMRCEEREMIMALKDLQAYAELILFTCLPESLVQNIMASP